jgi:hypothetical protein
MQTPFISISATLLTLIAMHCSFANSTVMDHLLRTLINFAVTLPTQCEILITLGHFHRLFKGWVVWCNEQIRVHYLKVFNGYFNAVTFHTCVDSGNDNFLFEKYPPPPRDSFFLPQSYLWLCNASAMKVNINKTEAVSSSRDRNLPVL